ncbi:MAG: hypothetical protein FJX72_10390 [Armatimonadetes bacterium]|nr:hypothetical protein [Armatimonadota bacterium]
MTVERGYDAAGREVLLRSVKSDGSAGACYTATHDPVGNRLAVEEMDGARVTYTHDAAYHLVGEVRSGAHGFAMTLSYDALGNRLTKEDSSGTTSYQYNLANELTLTTPPSGAPTTSGYDPNGNLALEVTGSARTTMTWDGENRLTRLELPDGTTEENNPVPEARLFHRRYATTRRFCSQPYPGIAGPRDLFASRGLSLWVSRWPRCGPSAPSYRI